MHRIDFKLHILIILNDADKWAVATAMLDHSKITKMPFWMIVRAKNEVFEHFLEFGQLDRLDIVYHERNICFTTLVSITRSGTII